MLQHHSDDFFQQPLIFFGSLDADEEETEAEFQINWDPVWQMAQNDLPLTGLFFHWAETID